MKEEVLERKAAEIADLGTRQKGLEFRRYFTREGISPYDTIEWEYRTAAITSESGEVIFEQKNVEVPKGWSMTATNIVASKYFHGKRGTPERETSVRQLIGRVASTITSWEPMPESLRSVAVSRITLASATYFSPRQIVPSTWLAA